MYAHTVSPGIDIFFPGKVGRGMEFYCGDATFGSHGPNQSLRKQLCHNLDGVQHKYWILKTIKLF